MVGRHNRQDRHSTSFIKILLSKHIKKTHKFRNTCLWIYSLWIYSLSPLENTDENRIFFVRSAHHKHFGKDQHLVLWALWWDQLFSTVNPSQTDESWEGRNSCLWIYIYYEYIYIYIYNCNIEDRYLHSVEIFHLISCGVCATQILLFFHW